MVRETPGRLATFVVDGQALIAKALRSLLDRSARIRVVGDASLVRGEDIANTRPDVLLFGLDNASQSITQALAIARSAMPDIRFCVLSSFVNREIMQRAVASGANAFIVKDIGPAELDDAIGIVASGLSYVDPRLAGGLVKRRHARASDESVIGELTVREADILRLIAIGLSNKEISIRLKLSEKTIKNYVSRIFSKVHVTARTQAAVFAIKAGFA